MRLSFLYLCKRFKISMITSRPYNPRAQGKVERSYRELRKKIHYDIVNLKSKGVNWVEHLPYYMRVLNDLARE